MCIKLSLEARLEILELSENFVLAFRHVSYFWYLDDIYDCREKHISRRFWQALFFVQMCTFLVIAFWRCFNNECSLCVDTSTHQTQVPECVTTCDRLSVALVHLLISGIRRPCAPMANLRIPNVTSRLLTLRVKLSGINFLLLVSKQPTLCLVRLAYIDNRVSFGRRYVWVFANICNIFNFVIYFLNFCT